jgi:hypothetical protein
MRKLVAGGFTLLLDKVSVPHRLPLCVRLSHSQASIERALSEAKVFIGLLKLRSNAKDI